MDDDRDAGEPSHAALTYGSYLALDEVLGAQRPRSDEHEELHRTALEAGMRTIGEVAASVPGS